ncbi:antitoxin [Streptomyces glaucescens]|uniref:antitoxin n=1 Tax=Streptomyces glaucescens TaxID=1907 RepID=UPI00344D762B
MGLFDRVKARLVPARDKVSGLAQQHGDRIQHGIDRAAKVVDERTKGKYSDRIQSGSGKAKGAVERLAHKDGTGPGGTTGAPPSTPPGTPPPAS